MSDATTIDETLRRAVGTGDEAERDVTLPAAFQGLPAMAHGGTVLALFDAAAGHGGYRRVVGHYVKRVPLGAPLRLTISRDTREVECRLLDDAGTLLVDGRVESVDAEATPAGRVHAPVAGVTTGVIHALPVSSACFVCGVDNAVGLRAQLGFDDHAVRGTWHPRPGFACVDGSLTTAAVTSLLDEVAFWLGALATGESGMTTLLDVSLGRRPEFGRPLTVVGDRARVVPTRDDSRYLTTEVRAVQGRADAPEGRADAPEIGEVVATARIVFVAVRGAARRLVTALQSTNEPEVIRRVFPAYL